MHSGRVGRPRSEQARTAVLHAVDDLLLDVGYAAMTMKGVAERAGVGRQTVYRWWSTKAEILFEACNIDAEQELAVEPTGDPTTDAAVFLEKLIEFLTHSAAGAAYRALVGEAQHDPAVAELLAARDVVGESARRLLSGAGVADEELDFAVASLIGAPFFWIMTGRPIEALHAADLAATFAADHRIDRR